jgi:hypothetical protein
LEHEPIEDSRNHNQLGNTWFGTHWITQPVQHVATNDSADEVHDKRMSDSQAQIILTGEHKSALQ